MAETDHITMYIFCLDSCRRQHLRQQVARDAVKAVFELAIQEGLNLMV